MTDIPIMGCIKPDEFGSWYIKSDTSHVARNISAINVVFQAGYGGHVLELTHTAVKAIALTVTPDDDMAGIGITVGNNMGTDKSLIRVFQDGRQLDPRKLYMGNIWINGWGEEL